jgi:hypothetical protein
MPRWVLVAGAGLLVAGLVAAAIFASRMEGAPSAMGEAAASSAATPRPASPSPSPTPEIVLWADGVCEARDALVGSVIDVAGSLEFDSNAPESLGDQFQEQIPGQLSGVEAAAAQLGSALGGIPVDYVDAAAAIPILQQRLDALNVSKDEALGHVDDARSSGNPVASGISWLRAAAAAKATYDAGLLVTDSLQQLADSADGDVRDAFSDAPRCASWRLG